MNPCASLSQFDRFGCRLMAREDTEGTYNFDKQIQSRQTKTKGVQILGFSLFYFISLF